jgi:hypothetical protein
MCKNCYNSQMGVDRRREQNEAAEAFKSQKFKGYNDPAYLATHSRCVTAGKAMSALHNDYWMAVAREVAQSRNGGFSITHADRRGRV